MLKSLLELGFYLGIPRIKSLIRVETTGVLSIISKGTQLPQGGWGLGRFGSALECLYSPTGAPVGLQSLEATDTILLLVSGVV